MNVIKQNINDLKHFFFLFEDIIYEIAATPQKQPTIQLAKKCFYKLNLT